jgi:radical SAM protein with 4Fe4S-binding SPASM domain
MKALNKSIITTFLIEQMHCDSSCAYCYLLQGKNINIPYNYSGELATRLDEILEFSKANFKSPLVKICGGEMFLMENLHEYTKKLLKEYAYVLIQTNARLIKDEDLEWIIKEKRVLLQISIDGHTLEMNKYRFRDKELMDKVLHTLAVLKKNDVYTEVTSVIHKFNIEKYEEFLQYLDALPGGKIKNAMKATPLLLIDQSGIYRHTPDKIMYIQKLVDNYNKYAHILPPKAYMKNYLALLRGKHLEYTCYNPIVSLTVTDEGNVKGCTNVLSIEEFNVGNIFRDGWEEVKNRFGNTKFQKLLLETKQRVPVCRKCFNFCSIYNLYFNGTITLEELCENNPMFNLPEVREALLIIRKELEVYEKNEVARV